MVLLQNTQVDMVVQHLLRGVAEALEHSADFFAIPQREDAAGAGALFVETETEGAAPQQRQTLGEIGAAGDEADPTGGEGVGEQQRAVGLRRRALRRAERDAAQFGFYVG